MKFRLLTGKGEQNSLIFPPQNSKQNSFQKYAQQYDGFILDLTGGFQNFSATFAEFLQDFLLALHSEKASGKPPKKQRRIFGNFKINWDQMSQK